MPFVIQHSERGYCVYTQDESGDPKGDPHGCHPTKEQAVAQMRALYANVEDARKADAEKPYGDVKYADPGYRDNQKRYPIDTEAHCRAAWSYINQADNRKFYTAEQLAAIEGRIKAAGKRFGIEFSENGKSEALMITLGPAVKAIGGGKVAGYLITWGSEATKDSDGEWFTQETEFDTAFPARASVYYHHGQDPAVGRQRLTHGTMTLDDFGIRIECQLNMGCPKQAAIYRRAEKSELGWSSGSLPHITIPPRENPGGAILQWPLGHDASLTPIPSDKRNIAIALKSVAMPAVDPLDDAPRAPWSSSLAENTDRWMDDGMYVLSGYTSIAQKAGRKLSAARRERLMQMRQMIDDLLSETEPREAAAVEESALPLGMSDGAEGEKAAPGTGAGLPTLPDLSDLYAQAMRQYAELAPLPGV